jgi:Tfp pilus assembly protein PilF
MRYTGIFRRERLWSAAVVGAIALTIVLVGCGDDKGNGADVETRTEWKPAVEKTVTVTPPDREIPSPVEPEEERATTVVTEIEAPQEVTYEEAEAAYQDKRYDEAVKLFTRYTEGKSENPWGFYMLGLSAWKAGDHEIAEKALERALELDPDHVKSQLNLSRVYLDTERPDKALVWTEKTLAIDPESNDAHRLQGRAYSQLGQVENAIAAYHKAIMSDEQDAWSMNNLGLIFIEEERFVEALLPLARAVALRDDVAVFQNNLGMALERVGHFRAAEEAYRSAVAIDGSHKSASSNLARVESVIEDPDIGAIDLKELAHRFDEEIGVGREMVIEKGTPTMVDPEPVIAIESDSTAVGKGP